MSASPPSRPLRGERAARVVHAFAQLAVAKGLESRGQHHRNYVLPLTELVARLLNVEAGTLVTVRFRRADVLPVVIRTWDEEARVVDAVRDAVPATPACLVRLDGFSVHAYVEGVPLSSVCADGKPVDTLLVNALAELLARMTHVRREALPPLPPEWPRNDKDSQGFLRTLVRRADRQIRQPNEPDFGGLFAALGIPEDALVRLADRIPAMARRPYSLLHADLHRDNVIRPCGGDPLLVCIDWELATYGDPLHDLAVHLVRMRYPRHQWGEVIDAWACAMDRVRPAAVNGLGKDLRHYLAFERAQSVYPDVMRTAEALQHAPDQDGLDEAAAGVHRALQTAAEPLGLRNVPDRAGVERALYRWRASRTALRGGPGRTRGRIEWFPDRRLPERPDFPAFAVDHALVAEGMAPAGRVFKGTAHLNSVVRVPGVASPVVVRRELPSFCRREPSYLSEHAVLRAIEQSGAPVAAPRVLALGRSHRDEQFAIHTYVGPEDTGRPPGHPVHGLLPHEADGLVDQLCALTKVDYTGLDPVGGRENFFGWLCEELVRLVKELPQDSQRLAWHLGLPDADRLHQILSRYRVGTRRPALLHGDLNPWNLVRSDHPLALTIIDWEMALIGDPLYDLVRHMHLTPTRPEIRARMFRRWERGLPEEYTVGWQRDWPVYRWVETVRSAYIDLDRLVTGVGLDAPNVSRAVDSYAMTLEAAVGFLGLKTRSEVHPCLARFLGWRDHGLTRSGSCATV